MIFGLSLVWNGKTPSLLTALRGDKGLYEEALAVFNKINTFTISECVLSNIHKKDQKLEDSFIAKDMSTATLKKIQSILIKYVLLKGSFEKTSNIPTGQKPQRDRAYLQKNSKAVHPFQ